MTSLGTYRLHGADAQLELLSNALEAVTTLSTPGATHLVVKGLWTKKGRGSAVVGKLSPENLQCPKQVPKKEWFDPTSGIIMATLVVSRKVPVHGGVSTGILTQQDKLQRL